MRLFERYISNIWLQKFFVSSAFFSGLFTFQALIPELIDQKYTTRQLLTFHCLHLLQTWVDFLPPSALVTVLLIRADLSKSGEWRALESFGFSTKRIHRWILMWFVNISVLLVILQLSLLPTLHAKKMHFYWSVMREKPDPHLDLQHDKIWYRSGDAIYFLKHYDSLTQTIHGVSLHFFNQAFQLVETLSAEKAIFAQEGWILLKGVHRKIDPSTEIPTFASFEERHVQLKEKPSDFHELEKDTDRLPLIAFGYYLDRLKHSGIPMSALSVKWHVRLASIFTPLIMAICALSLIRNREFNRNDQESSEWFQGLSLAFAYWLTYSLSLSMGTKGSISPWLAAWGPALLFTSFTTVKRWQRH